MDRNIIKAAWILGLCLLLAAAGLFGGIWWAATRISREVTTELDASMHRIDRQLEIMASEIKDPIQRLFHDPVPIQAVRPVAVELPEGPLAVQLADIPLVVRLPEPVQIAPSPVVVTIGSAVPLQEPITVEGNTGERDALPVKTDVNLFGGD